MAEYGWHELFCRRCQRKTVHVCKQETGDFFCVCGLQFGDMRFVSKRQISDMNKPVPRDYGKSNTFPFRMQHERPRERAYTPIMSLPKKKGN